MVSVYEPCPCKSGKKFKFCCYDLFSTDSDMSVLANITNLPVLECVVGANFQEIGVASIVATRGFSRKYAKCFVEPDRGFQDTFEFGKDGKPLLISGPFDNLDRLIRKN